MMATLSQTNLFHLLMPESEITPFCTETNQELPKNGENALQNFMKSRKESIEITEEPFFVGAQYRF